MNENSYFETWFQGKEKMLGYFSNLLYEYQVDEWRKTEGYEGEADKARVDIHGEYAYFSPSDNVS